MKRLTAIGVVFLLFVAGVLAGVVGTHAFYAHHVLEPGQLIDLGARWHVRRLQRILDLNEVQEEHLRRLVRRTQGEVGELREGLMPQVRESIERAHSEFLQTLDAEQRERFEKTMRRHAPRYLRAFGFPREVHRGGRGLSGHLRQTSESSVAADEAAVDPAAANPE